jgi:hypothetical protein
MDKSEKSKVATYPFSQFFRIVFGSPWSAYPVWIAKAWQQTHIPRNSYCGNPRFSCSKFRVSRNNHCVEPNRVFRNTCALSGLRAHHRTAGCPDQLYHEILQSAQSVWPKAVTIKMRRKTGGVQSVQKNPQGASCAPWE